MAVFGQRSVLVGLAAIFLAYPYISTIQRTARVVGVGRTITNTVFARSDEIIAIADTVHCEDLHLHEPSGLLFAACEDDESTRFSWFPPLAVMDDPRKAMQARGSIHVIDPVTFTSKRLEFENFDPPFITHGIDIIDDPARAKGEAIYIYAVNHVPNPEYLRSFLAKAEGKETDKGTGGDAETFEKAASQIELFYHVIGSSTVRHIRSLQHPLVTTPNDIYAESPTSILVTNDHYYRETSMRMLEDFVFAARWTTTVRLTIPDVKPRAAADAAQDVEGTVVLSGMHNNNGLGHGRTDTEVLVASAGSGVLHVGILPRVGSATGDVRGNITVLDQVEFDSTIDNPSYFRDPYATETDDRSGVVISGLALSMHLAGHVRSRDALESSFVWLARPGKAASPGGPRAEWEKTLIFADDGHRIRSASATVILAIDPAKEGGARKGWLFVTGFHSTHMLALKIDL